MAVPVRPSIGDSGIQSEQECDFFNAPTLLITSLLSKDFPECIVRARAYPKEVSTWMAIASNSSNDDKTKEKPQKSKPKRKYERKKLTFRKSLRNLYANDENDDEEDGESSPSGGSGKKYLLRRLPIHFACTMLPERGSIISNGEDEKKKLEELILLFIRLYPDGCQKVDHEGKLPLHEAVQNDTTPDIVEALLRKYPIGAQIYDNYGRTPLSIRKFRCDSHSVNLEDDSVYMLLSRGVRYWTKQEKKMGGSDNLHLSEKISNDTADEELEEDDEEEGSSAEEDATSEKPADTGKRTPPRRGMLLQKSKGSIELLSSKEDLEVDRPPASDRRTGLTRSLVTFSTKLTSVDEGEGKSPDLSKSLPPKSALRTSTNAGAKSSNLTCAKATTPNQKRHHVKQSKRSKPMNDSAAVSCPVDSDGRFYQKYTKLKEEYRNLLKSKALAEKQMGKMQRENEEKLHRYKSRTKTTVSNLRADKLKLEDEKFVLMAAMEEMKNRLDFMEIENGMLKSMYESRKRANELNDDINRMSASRGVSTSTLERVGEDEDYKVTRAYSSPPTIEKPSLSNPQSENSSEAKTGSIPQDSPAMVAAMKMLALAKKDHGDDLQSVANETLAAQSAEEEEEAGNGQAVSPTVYNYVQEENEKMQSRINDLEIGRNDLEDQVQRLKIALEALASKKSESSLSAHSSPLKNKTSDESAMELAVEAEADGEQLLSDIEEEPTDYKEEFHALLEALESSDRYATEAFLTKRVQELEFQLEDTIEARESDAAAWMGLQQTATSEPPVPELKPATNEGSHFQRYLLPELKKEIRWLYVDPE